MEKWGTPCQTGTIIQLFRKEYRRSSTTVQLFKKEECRIATTASKMKKRYRRTNTTAHLFKKKHCRTATTPSFLKSCIVVARQRLCLRKKPPFHSSTFQLLIHRRNPYLPVTGVAGHGACSWQVWHAYIASSCSCPLIPRTVNHHRIGKIQTGIVNGLSGVDNIA